MKDSIKTLTLAAFVLGVFVLGQYIDDPQAVVRAKPQIQQQASLP